MQALLSLFTGPGGASSRRQRRWQHHVKLSNRLRVVIALRAKGSCSIGGAAKSIGPDLGGIFHIQDLGWEGYIGCGENAGIGLVSFLSNSASLLRFCLTGLEKEEVDLLA
uniref:Uncharacterized protein n=1 Tax=Sphaerodactylus townsendi TaxID=933632 RepID=A0ACB8FUJ2_9SAUR